MDSDCNLTFLSSYSSAMNAKFQVKQKTRHDPLWFMRVSVKSKRVNNWPQGTKNTSDPFKLSHFFTLAKPITITYGVKKRWIPGELTHTVWSHLFLRKVKWHFL